MCRLSGLNPVFEKVDTKAIYGNKYQDIERRVPAVEKVKRYVGWEAKTDVTSGLAKTLEWARSQK